MARRNRKGTTVALRETIWLSLDTLRVHKLRSFLTLLGVILAVTTLVAVISIVEGLNRYISDRVANLGANAFVINQMGIITSFKEWNEARKRPPVRIEDFEALRDQMQLASSVAGGDDMRKDVRYGNEVLEDVYFAGVTPNFAEVRGISLGLGRGFTEADYDHRSPVCFVGMDIVTRFFPHVDPIGKSIRIGNQVYEVVGVAATRGTTFGQSNDNFVFIPFSTYVKSWFRGDESMFILVAARSAELMEAAQDEARAILRARRHVPYNSPDNFGVIAPNSIMGLWNRLTGNIFAIAVWLTSVFLVVGGVVIMNIMLASVTERTREIGIRKSLGARRRHIVMQFLVESSLLAGLGGLIGIVAALAIGAVVTATTPMPISTPMRAIVMALALSTSVGLFFGIYPAVRAARLDPIEALRSEG